MIRYALITQAILIVCLATMQGLFLVLVPMVDYWREDVEAILSERLGASVSIAKLGAKTDWTGPYLEAVDVKIQHEEASFNIERVQVLFDLIRSAESLELMIETLVLDTGKLISHQDIDYGYPAPVLWPDLLDKAQSFLTPLGKLRVYNVDVVLGSSSLKKLSIESTPEFGILAKTRLETEAGSFPVNVDWRFANAAGEHDIRIKMSVLNAPLPIPQIDHSISLVGTFWSSISAHHPSKIQFVVTSNNAMDPTRIRATGDLLWTQEKSEIQFDQLLVELPGLKIGGDGSHAIYEQSHIQLEPLAIQLDGNTFGNFIDVIATQPKLRSFLRRNNPQIGLSNVRMHWDFEHDPYLDGVVDTLSLDASGGVPLVGPVSGRMVLTKTRGYIDFEARSARFALPDIFGNPWFDQKLKGILAFDGGATGLVIRGHDLLVSDTDQLVTGDFLLDIPNDAEQLIQIELLADVNRTALPSLIPSNLDKKTIDFLETSLIDVVVTKGRISYSGPIGHGIDRTRRDLSMHLPTQSYRFKPLRQWPAFIGKSGLVQLSEKRVQISLSGAKFGDLIVPQVMAKQSKGDAGIIQIAGQIQGEAAIAFDILEQAEVKLNKIGQDLLIDGLIRGDVHLKVPINGRPEGYIDLTTQSVDLAVVGFDESIQQISGGGRFTLHQGFESKNLKGVLSGDPIVGQISVNDQTIRIEATGNLDIQNVRRYTYINFPDESISGRSKWTTTILRQGENLSIVFQTDGVGIESQLPMPLTKKSGDVGRIVINLERTAEAYNFIAEIFEDTKIAGRLGTSPLAIEVVTPEVDLAGWATLSDLGVDAPSVAMLLRTDVMTLGQMRLAMDEVALNLRPHYIDMSFDGKDLAGRIERLGRGPLVLEIERLVLLEGDDWLDPPALDPLLDFDPGGLPSARIDISELRRGETTYRNVHAEVIAGNNRLDSSELSFVRDGQLFEGELSWVAANSETRTALILRAEGPKLGRFLRVNEDEPILEAQSGQFYANLTWVGSPVGFSALTSDGVVRLNLKKGRFLDLGNFAEVLRLFGILNIETITRRLRLDFLDLIQPGVAFDVVDAQAELLNGILKFDPEFVMSGPSSSFKLTGDANLRAKTLNQLLEVDIPLTNNLPLASVLLGAPQLGGAIYLVEKALGKKLIKVGKTDYRIEGSFSDPQISLIPPFFRKKDADSVDTSARN